MEGIEAKLGAISDGLDGGTLGVAATFLPTRESVSVNADHVFPTASVIKIAIVAELYAQAAEGRLSPETPVTVTDQDAVPGSGVLALLSPGLTLPLADLALLAIAVSDNTASNLCLAAVGGPDAVNRRMHGAWGMPNTTIHRPIRFALGPDDPPHTATGTPRDMLTLLMRLGSGALHAQKVVSDTVRGLLTTTEDNTMLPRYLEVNPYARDLGVPRPPFVVRHKTGAVTGVRNDAGLIEGHSADGTPGTLAICVYTKGVRDGRWTPANAGVEAVARVGKLACDHFFR